MSIESEIAWLTLDKGARLAGKYLDQLQTQITDCCSDGVREREEMKSELAVIKQHTEEKLSELTPLLKDLQTMREELSATLANLKKPVEPTTPR